MTPAPGCPVCGSVDLTVHVAAEDGRLTSDLLGSSRREVSPGRILRCRFCRLGFRESRPRPEELSRLYSQLDSTVYEAEQSGRSKTAQRHLRIVTRHVARGHLLDVGCASGTFLHTAVEAGWTGVGVEPSETLSAKAASLLGGRARVLTTSLEQADLPNDRFDAVTLWDVLEHVTDPVQFLQRCAALLRPGGFLFVNVPDLDSFQARLFGHRWPLLLPEHLNYFNANSLTLCARPAPLVWLHFGRRPASFSLEYVLWRLSQHRVIGARSAVRVARRLRIGRTTIPVLLGELYGVWRRSP
jgi:SAM-dependent methyltransferase